MPNYYFTLIIFGIFSLSLKAQCPSGDVELFSQAEVDAFAAFYPNCTEIAGTLRIGEGYTSTDINDLSGLSGIETVEGDLAFFYNDYLTSLEGLESVANIGGGLYLYRNNSVTNLTGLSMLNRIDGDLSVFRNDVLVDLTGLNTLDRVGGDFIARKNKELRTLDGLETVSVMSGFIAIRDNALLVDISGLSNLDPTHIDELYITGNRQLTNCAIGSICSYLTLSQSEINIIQNGTQCATRTQVGNNCVSNSNATDGNSSLASDNSITLAPLREENVKTSIAQIRLYPNPTRGVLQIRNVETQSVTVLNPQGQRIANFDAPDTQLDLSALPAGVYYLSFQTAGERFTERVVKVN